MKPRASFTVAVVVGLLMLVFPLHAKARDHDGDEGDAGPGHHHDRDYHHGDRDYHGRDHGRDYYSDSDRGAWHHDNGLHRGWYKHHHRDADDDDYDDDARGGGAVAPSTYGQRYYRHGKDMADYPYLCDEDRDQCVRNPDFHGTVPALPPALQPLPQPAANLRTNQALLTRRNGLVAREQRARRRYNQAVKNHKQKAAVYWLTRTQKLDAQIAALNGQVPAVSTLVNPTSGVGSAATTLAPVVQQMMTH
jgi:hypothetical protein